MAGSSKLTVNPKARMPLWVFFNLAVAPLAGWLGGMMLHPDARVLGPLLFISPGLAYLAGWFVLSRMTWYKQFRKKSFPEPQAPDSEMDSYASTYAAKSNLGHLRMSVSPRQVDRPAEISRGWNREITILLEPWEALDSQAREFAVARGYAEAQLCPPTQWWRYLGLPLGIFAGCLAATFNLWFIIPGQSALAVGTVLLSNRTEYSPANADLLALEWTRNLSAALSYIEASTPPDGKHNHSPYPGLSQRERINMLMSKARELGLAHQ